MLSLIFDARWATFLPFTFPRVIRAIRLIESTHMPAKNLLEIDNWDKNDSRRGRYCAQSQRRGMFHQRWLEILFWMLLKSTTEPSTCRHYLWISPHLIDYETTTKKRNMDNRPKFASHECRVVVSPKYISRFSSWQESVFTYLACFMPQHFYVLHKRIEIFYPLTLILHISY